MIRMMSAALAAAILTTGAVAALADTGNPDLIRMSYKAKTDQYCAHFAAQTGSISTTVECHSQADWAKKGVGVSRR